MLQHLSPLASLSPHLQLLWSEMKRCLHAKILWERLFESVLVEPFLAAMVNPGIAELHCEEGGTVGSSAIHGFGQQGWRSMSAQPIAEHFIIFLAPLFLHTLRYWLGPHGLLFQHLPADAGESIGLWLPRRGGEQRPCARPFPSITMQLPWQMSPLPSQPSPRTWAGITPFFLSSAWLDAAGESSRD